MKYLVQSDNEYPSCQLLTAINARAFLTGSIDVWPGTSEFETLVDLTCCRHGSALRINKANYYLRLATQMGPNDNRWVYYRIQEGRPVELSVFTEDFGYHSVLVIGTTREGMLDIVNIKKGEMVSKVHWNELSFRRYSAEAKALSFR